MKIKRVVPDELKLEGELRYAAIGEDSKTVYGLFVTNECATRFVDTMRTRFRLEVVMVEVQG